MKLCKLTRQDLTTHNDFQWELGVWREATGSGTEPCSSDVLHYYHHPILAVLLNVVHAGIPNPRLFEIEIDRELGTDGLKGWCKKQRLVKEVELPRITMDQAIEFAIRVAMIDYKHLAWLEWAENWLNGSDRTSTSAQEILDMLILPNSPYHATVLAASLDAYTRCKGINVRREQTALAITSALAITYGGGRIIPHQKIQELILIAETYLKDTY